MKKSTAFIWLLILSISTANPSRSQDTPTPTESVTVSILDVYLYEDQGEQEFTAYARLSNEGRSSETDVTVEIRSLTAIEGTDFEPVEPFMITIPVDKRVGTTTFHITPINDTIREPLERLLIIGTKSTGDNLTIQPNQGMSFMLIDDDNSAPIVPESVLDAPLYLRGTPGVGEVTLTWEPPFYDTGGVVNYSYRYKQNNQVFGFDASSEWSDIPGGKDSLSHTVTGLKSGLEYTFEVRAENERGGGIPARITVTLSVTVNTEYEEIPAEMSLLSNYPNPFNPSTRIAYTLDRSGPVDMTVYDLTGRTVSSLVDGVQPAGHHEVRFNAGDLPTGTYVYRLRAGTETLTRTMTLIR